MRTFSLIFVFIVLLGWPFSATGQGMEMKSYYDDEKKVVKEIYTIKSGGSNMLHGTYISFYKNGNTKTVGQYFENVSYGFWEFYYENGEMRMTGSLKDGITTTISRSLGGLNEGFIGLGQAYLLKYRSCGSFKEKGDLSSNTHLPTHKVSCHEADRIFPAKTQFD